MGSVPGSPEEVRAFFQTRLQLYLGFSALFWTLAGGLVTALAVLIEKQEAISGLNGLRLAIHGGNALVVIIAWLVFRRKARAPGVLSLVDVLATTLQGVFLGSMLLAAVPIVRYRPDLAMTLGLSFCLVARAAVVPSTPLRTVLVGVFAAVPVCVATFIVHSLAERTGASIRQHYAGDVSRPIHFVFWVMVFSGLIILLSAFVSQVIYGLQRQVQRALQLGQYTLEAEIGAGGMGVVYRARHAFLRRATAVKLLPLERAGASALARFEREVQVTSQLTHPNTVAVYDYGRTPGGVFYYAMEYLDGLDLQNLVDVDGPQPPARVVYLLRQIAGALGEAHERGLIHRDVKPSNVVLCERPLLGDMAKVLDFGLARDFRETESALSQTGSIPGTPLYMAPEQIQSPETLDGRADLYALGALGYFLCTGQPVFSGGNIVEVCAQHLHSAPVPPSQRSEPPVPAKLEQLLLACLEKAPARRPADARAVIAALDACDDCGQWTTADATRWWAERAPQVRARRPTAITGEEQTLAIART